jgi:hypothetical protein
MMTISSRVAGLALAASLVFAGAAYAQTPAPAASPAPAAAPATDAAPAAKTKSGKPRSAASIECSKQADAQGLHGKKVRGPFMKKCKADAKAAAAGAPASK